MELEAFHRPLVVVLPHHPLADALPELLFRVLYCRRFPPRIPESRFIDLPVRARLRALDDGVLQSRVICPAPRRLLGACVHFLVSLVIRMGLDFMQIRLALPIGDGRTYGV
eukprot:427561-Prorocentrum_minimum.AAC.2